jgi:Ca-activated chloride channel family protein
MAVINEGSGTLFTALGEFHFLRPEWLLVVIPALIISAWYYRQRNQAGSWDQVISAELLPLLLDKIPVKQRRALPLLALIGWILAALAMAGPTWERTPLPVHKQENALVVLFDLSPSMLSQDLKPNRLTRARLKLIDLMKQRQEGTTALVAYAGDSFVVSPLTDDADTIAALVPALSPNVMPSHGSHVEAAMENAIELILNAGLLEGNILLFTDGVADSAADALTETLENTDNIKLSIIGIGTAEGAPIPLGNGGFAKDSNGNIVIPKLEANHLKKLANINGGRYTTLTTSDSDLLYLTEQFNAKADSPNKQLERTYDSWNDQGYWLVLPLLFILSLAFRRGLLACLLLAPMLSTPETSYAFGWDDLWQTKNQQGARALEQGDFDRAQQTFSDPHWKAAAAYRNGDYEQATELYTNPQNNGAGSDQSHPERYSPNYYNQGNALAKSGKLEDALKSYNKALEKNPDNEDAQFNKALIEELLQQQNSQQQPSNNSSQETSENQPKNQSQNQSESDERGEDQQQDQQKDSNDEKTQDQSSQQDQKLEEKQQQEEQQQDQQKQDEQQREQQAQEQQTASPSEQKPPENTQTADQGQASSGNNEVEPMSDEEQQAMEQWLRKIPDDPGGLLREKFRYESKKRTYERRRGINQPSSGPNEERW